LDYLLPLIILAFTALMALLALESKSLIYGAISLGGFFLGLSVFFFYLNLIYLAIFQLLVYVGAVSVLILFAVMVIGEPSKPPKRGPFGGFGFLGGLLLALSAVFMGLVLIFSFLGVTLDPIFQSLFYIGPIAVFFAFVILFLGEPKERSRYRFKAFGVLGASLVFAGFVGVLSYLGSLPTYSGDVAFNIVDLADSLLNDYGLLIVVLGLLLAAAAFGAVALAKKEAEEQ
jgi:NADH:ubiquinone oxidoreductase subunit 6 (subunit J)